eukprot:g1887.t1
MSSSSSSSSTRRSGGRDAVKKNRSGNSNSKRASPDGSSSSSRKKIRRAKAASKARAGVSERAGGSPSFEVACFSKQCRSRSHGNEDRCYATDDLFEETGREMEGATGKVAFAFVCDGHGGDFAPIFILKHLPYFVAAEACDLKDEGDLSGPELWEETLRRAIAHLEKRFTVVATKRGDTSGACLTCLIVDGNDAICANVGDCRCVLRQGGQTVAVTRDHTCRRSDERRRILDAGGSIIGGRLEGILEPCRTIGDLDVKESAVEGVLIAEPEMFHERLLSFPAIFVLASDGVYDTCSNLQVGEWCAAGRVRDAARKIVTQAVSRGSEDDCTAVIVKVRNT